MGYGWRAASIGLEDISFEGLLPHRVHVQLDSVSEQTPEGLEYASLEVLIVLFVEYLQQMIDPHGDSNHLLGISSEVGGEPVVLRVIGNQHRKADVRQ